MSTNIRPDINYFHNKIWEDTIDLIIWNWVQIVNLKFIWQYSMVGKVKNFCKVQKRKIHIIILIHFFILSSVRARCLTKPCGTRVDVKWIQRWSEIARVKTHFIIFANKLAGLPFPRSPNSLCLQLGLSKGCERDWRDYLPMGTIQNGACLAI